MCFDFSAFCYVHTKLKKNLWHHYLRTDDLKLKTACCSFTIYRSLSLYTASADIRSQRGTVEQSEGGWFTGRVTRIILHRYCKCTTYIDQMAQGQHAFTRFAKRRLQIGNCTLAVTKYTPKIDIKVMLIEIVDYFGEAVDAQFLKSTIWLIKTTNSSILKWRRCQILQQQKITSTSATRRNTDPLKCTYLLIFSSIFKSWTLD